MITDHYVKSELYKEASEYLCSKLTMSDNERVIHRALHYARDYERALSKGEEPKPVDDELLTLDKAKEIHNLEVGFCAGHDCSAKYHVMYNGQLKCFVPRYISALEIVIKRLEEDDEQAGK